jgi:hypothetical protein
VDLRLQGLTYRAIGTEVGKDFSYVARVVKKALAERRAEESVGQLAETPPTATSA